MKQLMILLFSMLLSSVLASCANINSERGHAISSDQDLIESFPGEIVRQALVEKITLNPVGEFSRTVYTSTQGEVISTNSIHDEDGLLVENIEIDDDDIRMSMTVKRYPNKMIERFEINEVFDKSSRQSLSRRDIGDLKDIFVKSGFLNGYNKAGDYALGKTLYPEQSSRCLAYEVMAENTLKFMYEQAGGRQGQATALSNSKCTFLGLSTLNGREVAVFSEAISSSIDAPRLRRSEFVFSGWRAVDVETGQDYRHEMQGDIIFDGKSLVGSGGFKGWSRTAL